MFGKFRRKSVFLCLFFVFSLALLQVISTMESSGVTVEQVWLTTSEGVRLKAEIYRPVSVSAHMPGIVICHGLLASHQTMQSRFSLDFAKRGFVVAAVDLQGHGDSEGSISIDGSSNTNVFGDDDYIEVSNDSSLDLQKEFTLSAWINAGAGMEQIIIDKKLTYQDRNYKLSLSDNGALELRFSSSSNDLDGDVTGNTDLRNSGWRHVVGVYNGTHCYLFIDGEFQVSDPTISSPEGVGSDLWIGRGSYAGSQREFNGTIDEVQISNVARSAAWIKASYESERDHLISFGSEETKSDEGWLSDWSKRIKITIGHRDLESPLSDFPILIHLSHSSGINNTDVSNIFDELEKGENRKRIAVTTNDGVTQCFVEIDKWDHADEEAWLWVKVPNTAASEDTGLYLYYDNGHVDNVAYVGDTGSLPAENVWDTNFKLVTHMSDDADTIHVRDSTSNNNDGIKKFGPNEVAGKMGQAQHFSVKNLLQKGAISVNGELELDVKAAVDYLLSRTDVDHSKIAVLGHSLGGAAVIREAYSDPRVKSVVAIAPGSWVILNSTFPQNLILLLGSRDFIVRESSLLDLLRMSTGGHDEISRLFGDFSKGNARKMMLFLGTDHAGEMFDPRIVEEAIRWMESSLNTVSDIPISTSPWYSIFFPLSLITLLLSIYPTIVCVEALRRLLTKGKPTRNIESTQSIRKHAFLYLLGWGVALSTFMIFLLTYLIRLGAEGILNMKIWPFNWIPVIFAEHLMVIHTIACSILLIALITLRRTNQRLNLNISNLRTNIVLGGSGFIIVFSVFNIVFTRGFIDLFPTNREISLIFMMFPFLLPLNLLEEVWLSNIQQRLPHESWKRIGIPIAIYLSPRLFPLIFASIIFGDFALFALTLMIVPALFKAWLFNESGSIIGGTTYNTFFYAWILAVILPFGG